MLKTGFKLFKKALGVDGPVPWSDNTAFPISGSLSNPNYFVGLQGGLNAKWSAATVLAYINSMAQLASVSQVTGLPSDLAAKLDIAGGALTGPVTAAADPTAALGLATKQYVDNSIGSADTFQDVYNNSSPPSFNINSNGFSINTSTGDPLFEIGSDTDNFAYKVNSTTQGSYPFPRVTTTEMFDVMNYLGPEDEGMMFYDSTDNIIYYWDGSFGQSLVVPSGSVNYANYAGAISGLPITSNVWTPTFTGLVGISGSITLIGAQYMQIGNIITFTQSISFTASDSVIQFITSIPINFITSPQALLMGQSLTASTPNIGDGQLISAAIVPSSNTIQLNGIVAVGSGLKFLQFSVSYKVQ